MPDNERKFREMLKEVFLLDAGECLDSYSPDQIKTWDSVTTLVLASAIKHYFGIKLEIREITAIRNIGDIRTSLRARGVPL